MICNLIFQLCFCHVHESYCLSSSNMWRVKRAREVYFKKQYTQRGICFLLWLFLCLNKGFVHDGFFFCPSLLCLEKPDLVLFCGYSRGAVLSPCAMGAEPREGPGWEPVKRSAALNHNPTGTKGIHGLPQREPRRPMATLLSQRDPIYNVDALVKLYPMQREQRLSFCPLNCGARGYYVSLFGFIARIESLPA